MPLRISKEPVHEEKEYSEDPLKKIREFEPFHVKEQMH